MASKAWMLRYDGQAFEVIHHFYAMKDKDLSSEAEVSAFMINTNSGNIKLHEYTIDCWLALLIEKDITYDADGDKLDEIILNAVNHLPYRFQYPLSANEILDIHKSQNNFNGVDTYYEFLDRVESQLSSIQQDVSYDLNQTFCRVRYGGQYRSSTGNPEIWFRISSVGFNWADRIYIFTLDLMRVLNIQYITICRDHESDFGDVESGEEYFYKAKDGAVYYHMPIEEFIQEEHEHSYVFSSKFDFLGDDLLYSDIFNDDLSIFSKYIDIERTNCCISASEFLDNASTKTRNWYGKIMKQIRRTFDEIESIDVDVQPYATKRGTMTGKKIIFELGSSIPEIDGLQVDVAFTRFDPSPQQIYDAFCEEYSDYKKYKKI